MAQYVYTTENHCGEVQATPIVEPIVSARSIVYILNVNSQATEHTYFELYLYNTVVLLLMVPWHSGITANEQQLHLCVYCPDHHSPLLPWIV